MSTDLYGYRLLRKDKANATVKVINVYGDMKGLFPSPANPTFFLGIMSELSPKLKADIEASTSYEWYTEEAQRELGDKYIKRVEVVDIANPFEDMQTFYYVRDGHWEGEDQLPQVTYEIELAADDYLDDTSIGTADGTTMYQSSYSILHNDTDEVPSIDYDNLSEVATLPWVGNLQSLVAAMDSLMFERRDVRAYFAERPEERDRLLGRLRRLRHDQLAARNGWDREIAGFINRFRTKEVADEAMLLLMADYGSGESLTWALGYLAASAGVHPQYITDGLVILRERLTDEEHLFWIDYILWRNTGDEKYKLAFDARVEELLALDDEDRQFPLSKLITDAWRNYTAEELEGLTPYITRMAATDIILLRGDAKHLAEMKALA